ncbi:hypothetical protein CTB91_01670 [Dickeya solani]|uniref:Uncharacterized protein n=1 Tax=Dickeya solani D s0432-1 TaxID=1231725 RepID=A0AAV3KCX8_9GAMM|nr:hypothetical protein CTB91_01670 [Dickeya solani]ERO58470.1 hypothetical protein A544_1646 [Dickeya solani D s0432-1]AYQ51657.1 hypothetical protein DSOL99_01676 [Dickeya solani]MBD3606070.1 hypothetical protein [Dickeya solani]NUA39659.1 hypothetical protein [Dickeya solani]
MGRLLGISIIKLLISLIALNSIHEYPFLSVQGELFVINQQNDMYIKHLAETRQNKIQVPLFALNFLIPQKNAYSDQISFLIVEVHTTLKTHLPLT